MVKKILEAFHHSITILSFVLFLMVILEVFNQKSRGYILNNISRNKYVELLISIVLGLIPGNFGSFMAVSLYSHGAMSFGALVANIIAAFGDELLVFIYYSVKESFFLILIIAAIAFVVGFIVNKFYKPFTYYEETDSFEVENMIESSKVTMFSIFNIKYETKSKLIVLISFLLLFLFSVMDSVHNHSSTSTSSFNWKSFFLIIIGVVALYILLASSSKFFNDVFLKQIVKPKIIMLFILVFIVMLFIALIPDTVIKGYVHSNYIIVLVISIILGVLPISGTSVIFILMYINGNIPIGILLANCIVNDSLGSFPLLSESKEDFIKIKIICVLVAIVVGFACWFIK